MLQYQLLASLRSAFLCAETRKHYPEIIGHEVGVKSQIVRNCKRNTRRLQTRSAHASVFLFLVAESGYQIKYRKSAEYCRKQKQKGLFAVSYHPTGGKPAPAFMISLYELLKDMEQVKIRLSPDQGIYVINLNKEEALKVLELTQYRQYRAFITDFLPSVLKSIGTA